MSSKPFSNLLKAMEDLAYTPNLSKNLIDTKQKNINKLLDNVEFKGLNKPDQKKYNAINDLKNKLGDGTCPDMLDLQIYTYDLGDSFHEHDTKALKLEISHIEKQILNLQASKDPEEINRNSDSLSSQYKTLIKKKGELADKEILNQIKKYQDASKNKETGSMIAAKAAKAAIKESYNDLVSPRSFVSDIKNYFSEPPVEHFAFANTLDKNQVEKLYAFITETLRADSVKIEEDKSKLEEEDKSKLEEIQKSLKNDEGNIQEKLSLDQENSKVLIELIQKIYPKDPKEKDKKIKELGLEEGAFDMQARGNVPAHKFVKEVIDKKIELGQTKAEISIGRARGVPPFNSSNLDCKTSSEIIKGIKNGLEISVNLRDGPNLDRAPCQNYKDMFSYISKHESTYNTAVKGVKNVIWAGTGAGKVLAKGFWYTLAGIGYLTTVVIAIPKAISVQAFQRLKMLKNQKSYPTSFYSASNYLKESAKKIKMSNDSHDKIFNMKASRYASSYNKSARNAIVIDVEKQKYKFFQEMEKDGIYKDAMDVFAKIENDPNIEISQHDLEIINNAYYKIEGSCPFDIDTLNIYQYASNEVQNSYKEIDLNKMLKESLDTKETKELSARFSNSKDTTSPRNDKRANHKTT